MITPATISATTGGNVDPLGDLGRDLGRDEDDEDVEEDVGDVHLRSRAVGASSAWRR